MRYDDAVATLYQAPLDQFVAERKRLAGELKAAGDKDAATRFGKLARPPISAWVVNQLWWHARDAFDALFATAEELRDGKLAASGAHREAIAKLRARAQALLTDAGHGATEATLRRVTQTLSALAATGTWDPDPAGALAADRDPPGFEAVGIAAPPVTTPARPAKSDEDDGAAARKVAAAEKHRQEAEAAAARAEAAAERRRAEEAEAKAKAERHRLEAALRTAKGEITVRERDVEKLEKELATARDMVEQAKAVVEDLEQRLEQLAN